MPEDLSLLNGVGGMKRKIDKLVSVIVFAFTFIAADLLAQRYFDNSFWAQLGLFLAIRLLVMWPEKKLLCWLEEKHSEEAYRGRNKE